MSVRTFQSNTVTMSIPDSEFFDCYLIQVGLTATLLTGKNAYLKCFFVFCFVLFFGCVGLLCCTQAFSSCRERGLLFVAVCWLLIDVASLVAVDGFQACKLSICASQAQQLWHAGLVAPRHVGSLDQGLNPCPLHWQADS